MSRKRRQAPLLAAVLALGLSSATDGCVDDSRSLRAARAAPKRWSSGVDSRSWGLCSLIGPNDHNPGIWGSDLGFTARTRNDERLTILFGDTWAAPMEGCQYPGSSNNDLQGTLPAERPARFQPGPPAAPLFQAGFQSAERVSACDLLEYAHEQPNDVTSWRRMRLFPSADAHRDSASIDLGGLRTPLAAFSDGERLLALFQRYDPADCAVESDCPSGMQCSTDPAYRGLPVGECTRLLKLAPDPPPDYCRDKDDCVPGADCDHIARGVCLATEPFAIDTPHGRVSPNWYREDPKRGLASVVHVAAAIWPDRPADYAVLARFATNRFQNATVRTVAYFDPDHPEHADYRPGYHTLLMWGRHSFAEYGGAQALPFLLYVPLDELRGAPEQVVWRPRFFAGYDDAGKPAWSERESDAFPIYGADLQPGAGEQLQWSEPEFDEVAQMSLSWVPALSRWVMMYGGDLPAFMVLEPRSGKARKPVHLPWASGAIHMRTAPHPWGAARVAPKGAGAMRAPAAQSGWSSAEPLLTREVAAPYLACSSATRAGQAEPPGCQPQPDDSRSLALLGALATAATEASTASFGATAVDCIGGALARAGQDRLSGDQIGRMYAPNIIDEWTQDVTDDAQRAHGESSAEVYWNVSTWNPYQVVLFKTQLTARQQSAPQTGTSAILVRTE